MSENHQAGSQPGVASMVGGILEDAQKLVRQEIALAQREVAQAWDKGKTAAALLASALVVFNVGGVLLGVMLAKLLSHLLPNHEWACFGIVGGLVALLGGALFYHGVHRISEVHLSLPQTVESLREDVQAVSAAVSGDQASTDPLLKR
jgi:Putative Actinobacterial Holin-X, holin superfamily III